MDYKQVMILKSRQVGKSYSSTLVYDMMKKHWALEKSIRRIKSIEKIFNIY